MIDSSLLRMFSDVCRAVGPGHVSLVMNDVLSKLVNVGYKPAKVLKELQMETDANVDSDMEKQVLIITEAKSIGPSFQPSICVCSSVNLCLFIRQYF